MQFQGKSVIITGAGKGIGRATALLMAARGARVVAISRTRSDLDSLARDTGGHGIAAILRNGDKGPTVLFDCVPTGMTEEMAGS